MMKELKPCPFCGGKAKATRGFRNVLFFKCTKCKVIVSFDNDTCNEHVNETIDYWNRRINQ